MNIYNQSKKVDVNIPLLLAGPIIRRVESSKICIWIATSKKVQARLRIFRLCGIEKGGQVNSSEIISPDSVNTFLESTSNLQLVGEGINSPLQLGDKLFINLIIAKPLNQTHHKEFLIKDSKSLGFPTNELLAYDLELISDSEAVIKETISLRDLGLLSGENSIIYSRCDDTSSSTKYYDKGKNGFNYPALPMFFIADREDASSLNLLYGSCRKLHGDDADSLIIGDKLLEDFFYDLNKRPSALFLIGDQIYADDVAGPLITFIKTLSSNLLGWEESLDGIEKKLGQLGIGERKEIVQKYANFSTDVGDNHLLGFGEFAAMYLLAWNKENWPEQFEQQAIKNLLGSSELKKYLNELKELEQSRQTLAGVRRLLANIPTYMICDDHEITDDWNINKKWCDEVDQSSCGKQIISNGLLAYWAFQAWGNDPDSFDDDFIEKIKHYLNLKKQLGFSQDRLPDKPSIKQSGTSFDPKKNAALDSSLIRDLEKNILMTKNWTFVAPTNPLSVFLDCRTQRTFVDEEGPPHLLSVDALEYIKLNLENSGYKNGNPLVIISPTPVFGFELAESVQRFLTSISGSYKWDLETWRANEKGFVKFLTYLANNFDPMCCIFLSGDVHYAFTMKAYLDHLKLSRGIGSLTERGGGAQEKTVIPMAQLTSSPFRSNSLRNRIVAILILNFIHKGIVVKKYLFKKRLANKKLNDVNFNYDYLKRLPDIHHQEPNSRTFEYSEAKQKIYFSKHGDDKSIIEKIRIITFNLTAKYFRKDHSETNQIKSAWTERRLLIKPKGQNSLPVLAKNNIGNVRLDLNLKSIENKLYFLDKGQLRESQAIIHLQ